MKKLLTVAVALAGLVFTSEAQVEKKEGMRQKHGMMQDLNLTEAQKQQLKASREEMKQQMQSLKNANLSQQELKDKRKSIMTAHQAKLKSILTPDQQAKMAEKRKAYAGKAKHGKGMKRGHGKFDKMEKLDLTPAQQARMKEINDGSRAQMEEVKKNTSLTDEARKQQMMQIRKQTMEARKQVLTAEQLKKMQEMKKDRPAKAARSVKK